MKVLALLLLFLIAISCIAQTTQPPDLSVLSYKWKRYHRAQVSPESDDPFTASDPQRDWAQNPSQMVRANAPRDRSGKDPIPTVRNTTVSASGVDDASRAVAGLVGNPTQGQSVEYAYEIKIENTGTKKIARVDWTYLLTDANSKREIGTHRFASVVNLSAGKTKKIVGRSLRPPTRVVKASGSAANAVESILIERIEYADGSTWQRVSPVAEGHSLNQ